VAARGPVRGRMRGSRLPAVQRSQMKCFGLMIAALLVVLCSHAGADAGLSFETASNESLLARNSRSESMHLSVEDRVQDILRHPAFAGDALLILPWDDRGYDEQMSMKSIGSLLPYHSHVEPRVVVSGLNRMIDDASRGQKIFYRFYSAEDRRKDPAKENTGLLYFRGNTNAPFAIIAPGGGFTYVGSIHEGFPFAMEISKRGYNAFVVRYRAGLGERAATEDLATAVSYLFRNAAELGIETAGHSAWGSSAGARMAANIGSYGVRRFGGDDLPKPSTVVMAYTAHSDFAAAEPPTFVVVGDRDGIAPPAVMERRVAELRNQGTTVEYRKYNCVGHGFGLSTGTSAGWISEAVRFWEAAIKRSR